MGPPLAELKTTMKSLRSQMKVLEEDLQRDPVPKPALRIMLRFAENKWNLVSKYHTWIKDEQ